MPTPVTPASGVGADVSACLTGAAELGVDVAGPSFPVCPLVATMISLFQSSLNISQKSYGHAIGANANSAKSHNRRNGRSLISPTLYSFQSHCRSLLLTGSCPENPRRAPKTRICGVSCVGRVSGFQKWSRGFRRLVALFPSLSPPGSLYPGLP